jgi:hypothetical protein
VLNFCGFFDRATVDVFAIDYKFLGISHVAFFRAVPKRDTWITEEPRYPTRGSLIGQGNKKQGFTPVFKRFVR